MESLGNVDLRGTVLPGSAWFVLGVVRSGRGSFWARFCCCFVPSFLRGGVATAVCHFGSSLGLLTSNQSLFIHS